MKIHNQLIFLHFSFEVFTFKWNLGIILLKETNLNYFNIRFPAELVFEVNIFFKFYILGLIFPKLSLFQILKFYRLYVYSPAQI